MKLYFKFGDSKRLIGEPVDAQETVRLILDDSKRRFTIPKGDLQVSFASGTMVYTSKEDEAGYILEE